MAHAAIAFEGEPSPPHDGLHDLDRPRATAMVAACALAHVIHPEQIVPALERTMGLLTDPAECGPVTFSVRQDVRVEACDCPGSFFAERLCHTRSIPCCWRAAALAGPCEVALCSAPGTGAKPALLIPPADLPEKTRGEGSNTRDVRNILADTDDRAENLLVVEVVTPAGNWSSYPPHKHDRDAFPDETLLEGSYDHRFTPRQGYGVQRVYTDDRSLDETMAIHDRNVVLVARRSW